MDGGRRRDRQSALSLVAEQRPDERRALAFCGHCGRRPRRGFRAHARVCESCGLGLILRCGAQAAPPVDGAFLVLDARLRVCAVSRRAEQLLAVSETDVVDRHLSALLVPAEAQAASGETLAAAIVQAAAGDRVTHTAVVRPANTFGVRINARIASCGPRAAALIVLEL